MSTERFFRLTSLWRCQRPSGRGTVMSTERFFLIRCDNCRVSCDPVENFEMKEAELRRDLTKRLGWLSFKLDDDRRIDVCPDCQRGGER
jgi:hypothetical protein